MSKSLETLDSCRAKIGVALAQVLPSCNALRSRYMYRNSNSLRPALQYCRIYLSDWCYASSMVVFEVVFEISIKYHDIFLNIMRYLLSIIEIFDKYHEF